MRVLISGSPDDAELHPIQVGDRVERLTLLGRIDAPRVRQIEDRIAGGAKRHALIGGRQKTAGPQCCAAARPARARLQHHKSRQIFRLAADSVGNPGAHARAAGRTEPVLVKSFAGP